MLDSCPRNEIIADSLCEDEDLLMQFRHSKTRRVNEVPERDVNGDEIERQYNTHLFRLVSIDV